MRDKIIEAIQATLGAVYKNEYRLIEQHCHELNIVGAFYYYFRTLFQERFSQYCIDMEYCRMKDRILPKEINVNANAEYCPFCQKQHGRRIRSDFIVHVPNTDNNLVVVEFKGKWSTGCLAWDENKLKELTKPIETRPPGDSYVCGYQLGVSVLLKEDGVELVFFEKGEKDDKSQGISMCQLIDKYEEYRAKRVEGGADV